MPCVDGAHLRELHQPLGLYLGVRTGVEQNVRPIAGNRNWRRDRRASDATDATHPKQRGCHRRTGVSSGDHCTGFAIAYGLSSAHEGRILLAAHALRGIVVHLDDFRGVNQR